MSLFQPIDTFKPEASEPYVLTAQKYVHRDTTYLRCQRPDTLLLVEESNLLPTTLPTLPQIEVEELYELREHLLEKRMHLLDTWFLAIRPKKNRELDAIDKRLDTIEYRILALQEGDRDRESANMEKYIASNDDFIRKQHSKADFLS